MSEVDDSTRPRAVPLFRWLSDVLAPRLHKANKKATTSDLAVALLFALRTAGTTGEGATIDDEKIAKLLNVSPRTVLRARVRLFEAGLFAQTEEARRGRPGRPGRKARYCLTDPDGGVSLHDEGTRRSADLSPQAKPWGDRSGGDEVTTRPTWEATGERDRVSRLPSSGSPSVGHPAPPQRFTLVQGEQFQDEDLIKIGQLTGGDAAHARRVAADILNRATQPPDRPLRYIFAAIEREPGRYRPTPRPPRREELCRVDGHSSHADNCSQCAADAKAAN